MTERPTDAADRTASEDLSPVWWMLAGGAPEGLVEPRMPIVCALPGPDHQTWRAGLADAVSRAQSQETVLLVAVARPLPRLVLDLLARRMPRLLKGPSPARVKDELEGLGLSIEGAYKLWPSIRMPRVAFPATRSRPLIWAQRSGVLGGGGNRTWARLAARSRLFTPLALLLSPGVAFVTGEGSDA